MGSKNESEGIERAIAKVIAQAWFDADLYRCLRADPMKALRDAGVALAGTVVVVSVVANPDMVEAAQRVQRSDYDSSFYEVILAEKPLYLEDESIRPWTVEEIALFCYNACCSCS